VSGTEKARIRTRCRGDQEDGADGQVAHKGARVAFLRPTENAHVGRDFPEPLPMRHVAKNEKSGDSLAMDISALAISGGSSSSERTKLDRDLFVEGKRQKECAGGWFCGVEGGGRDNGFIAAGGLAILDGGRKIFEFV
jgi:hypothetical protein